MLYSGGYSKESVLGSEALVYVFVDYALTGFSMYVITSREFFLYYGRLSSIL